MQVSFVSKVAFVPLIDLEESTNSSHCTTAEPICEVSTLCI